MTDLIPYVAGLAVTLAAVVITWLAANRRTLHESMRREAAEEKLAAVPEIQARLLQTQQERDQVRDENAGLKADLVRLQTTLEAEEKAAQERLNAYREAEARLTDTFKVLSSSALKSNNDTFLQLAQNVLARFSDKATGELDSKRKEIQVLVAPLSDSLKAMRDQVERLEQDRVAAQSSLGSFLSSLKESQEQLTGETRNLVQALRKPNVRGRWGEVQLRNVVEFAGMQKHCDFIEQESVTTGETGVVRPDMIIHMPGDKQVVVDSKTPVEAYLDAVESGQEDQRQHNLKRHAGHVRSHIDNLSSKKYWDQFADTPEFVVLFLPGENFFSAALEQEPRLIEYALERKILLATPTTLIALLKTIHYGWRQQKLEENARIISGLGRELHERIQTLVRHFSDLKRGLDRAVTAYNRAAGSLESRVLVTARRFQELGASSGDEIAAPEPVETATRLLNAGENDGENPETD